MNKRYVFAAIFMVIVLSLSLSIYQPVLKVQIPAKNTVIRLWGSNRYQTACAVSRDGWQSAGTVILTKGEGTDTFTDAITASALSMIFDAPLLFFGNSELDEDTIKEIERLKAKNVYVLGCDDAVFDSIKKQIEPLNKTVSRISGRDRYDTAVKIASEIKTHKPFTKIILTTGSQFQYALMAAPYAAREYTPVLFTETNTLPPVVKEALKSWSVKDVEVIGGQSVISENITGELKDMGINTSRIDGSIQEINLKIVDKYFPKASGISLARDDQFVDALVGMPLAAKKNIPVILTGGDRIAPDTGTYIKGMNASTCYIFGSTGVISQDVVDTLFPELYTSQFEQTGNTPGNVVNEGYIAVQNGWVYFSNLNDGRKLYKSDLNGNHLTRLSSNKCRGVNLSNDWVYYINESKSGSLYKIKTDGTEEQEVLNDTCFYPCIAGDWIYYVNYDDSKSIYRVDKSGTSRMKLNNDESLYINTADNWIYYSNLSDNSKLYRVKADGSGRIKLCDDKVSFVNVSGSHIYYSNQDDNNSIYRIRTDGTSRLKISGDSAFSLNIYGDYIYYVNSNKYSTIHRIKKDGSDKRFLNYERSNALNIADGWIYYYDEDSPGFFRINSDGSVRDYVQFDLIQPLTIPLI